MALFDWSNSIQSIVPDPSAHALGKWAATKGAKVKIALIDSGLDLSIPPFKHLAEGQRRRFFTGKTGFSPADLVGNDPVPDTPDPMGHCTLYASMVAARDTAAAGALLGMAAADAAVLGMAPAAEYCVIKARSAAGGTTKASHLLAALELAANLEVDMAIVGQSIFRPSGLLPDDVERVVRKIEDKKVLVFCALQNRAVGETWDRVASDYFPNRCLPMINCAKAPDDIAAVRSSIQGQAIHFLAAGFRGKLLKIGGQAIDLKLPGDVLLPPEERMDKPLSNSSAVYLIGGLAALCYGFARQEDENCKLDKAQMLDLLAPCCSFLEQATGLYDSPVVFQNYKSMPA